MMIYSGLMGLFLKFWLNNLIDDQHCIMYLTYN